MTRVKDAKDKKTLPAGSPSGSSPIVVPSPSTSLRAAITLSPPFPDASSSPAQPVLKTPPMAAAEEPQQETRRAHFTKTLVPGALSPVPPPAPSSAVPAPPNSPPSPRAMPPADDAQRGSKQKATMLIAHAPEPPVFADDVFEEPATSSAWPAARKNDPEDRSDALDLVPPSLAPPPVSPLETGEDLSAPLLVPVRSAKDRIDEVAAPVRAAWDKALPFGRSVFTDGAGLFRSLSRGQRIAATACVVGGLSIPLVGIALALAGRSAPRPQRSQAPSSAPIDSSSELLAAAAAASSTPVAPQPAASAPSSTTPVASSAPPPASSAVAPTPAVPPPQLSGACKPSGEPTLLAPRASKDVPIEVRVHTSRPLAAVGFATDGTTASGLVIDLTTLAVSDRFSKKAAKVSRVIPVEKEGGFGFEAHGRGAGMRDDQSLLIPGASKVLRWKKGAIAIAESDGRGPREAWKTEGTAEAVRVHAAAGSKTAVAWRSRGAIHLGWLEPGAESAGGASSVPDVDGKVGTPSLAWSGQSLLMAFAFRGPEDDKWGVRLARAELGGAATGYSGWTLPAGGPGGSAIAPAVASLDGRGWLLVWTEGEQGQRAVRMQTLSPSLSAIGDAVTVSGEGNAGQGVAAVGQEHGIVLGLAGTRALELWGRAITCR